MANLTKQEFLDRIQAIGACEDDVERRTLLADLSADGAGIYDEFDTAETARKTAEADNEKLRAANMKLFLRVGDHKEPEQPADPEPPKEKRKFENLFNAKGDIK